MIHGKDQSPQLDSEDLTAEVGDEGGTPGDLETLHSEIGAGSEAGELWRPADEQNQELPRNDTPGRRTP